MYDPTDEIHALMVKFGTWIITAIVSTMAKISNEILAGRKLSWAGWFAIVAISLFWSFMVGLFCIWKDIDPAYSSILIGLATLLGEKINIYVSANYKTIISKFLGIFTPKK